ncbi:hypothetical protein KCU85_g1657, partial [Aureobasidium melanogenum]
MTRKSKLELGEGTLAQCFPKVLPQTDQPAPSIRAPDEEAETGSTGSAKASMPAYNDVALYWDSQLYEYPGRYYESHKIFIALPHPTAAMASQAVGHESTRNVHRHHHLTRHQDAAKSLNPLKDVRSVHTHSQCSPSSDTNHGHLSDDDEDEIHPSVRPTVVSSRERERKLRFEQFDFEGADDASRHNHGSAPLDSDASDVDQARQTLEDANDDSDDIVSPIADEISATKSRAGYKNFGPVAWYTTKPRVQPVRWAPLLEHMSRTAPQEASDDPATRFVCPLDSCGEVLSLHRPFETSGLMHQMSFTRKSCTVKDVQVLYHYSQQACGVEMLQDYDCPYATCAGPPKETAYARLQHWMHKHAAKEYGSAGYGVIDEACEMVSPSQALVHNSNIRDGDKVVLIYLFQCTARNSTRWPISKKGAIPTGRLSTAQLVRIWKDFTSFVQTRVPSQYLTVLDTPPNPNLQVMLHTTWPGTAMSLPDSADDADEEGAMRDLRPKVSARAFTRSKAYEQRPNAGTATTAAPVEVLEDVDVRVAVEATFEEAEFVVPGKLMDLSVVEGIGNFEAEAEEVELALTVPPMNPVTGASLADATVELERDVEAVVATDAE